MIEVFLVAAAFLGLLVVLAAIRVLMGPTLPDRFLGLDTINTLVVLAMILLALGLEQWLLVDVALVYAMLSFVGSVFFADYLERTGETTGDAPVSGHLSVGRRHKDVALKHKRARKEVGE